MRVSLLMPHVPLVSHASHRSNELAARIAERLPQMHDHVVYGSLISQFVLAPKLIDDFVAADRPRRAGYQQFEQLEIFCRQEVTLTVRLHNNATVEFDRPIIAADAMQCRVTFEDVFDAQQQFAQMKWLRNELLRADFKAFEAVLSSAQRGHEHDRD